jgi:hypothetical protein
MEIIASFLGVGGGMEDESLIVLQGSQPMGDVRRMLVVVLAASALTSRILRLPISSGRGRGLTVSHVSSNAQTRAGQFGSSYLRL